MRKEMWIAHKGGVEDTQKVRRGTAKRDCFDGGRREGGIERK